MAALTTETLFDLKQYFDSQMESCLSSIRATDSDRLVKNKINGFIIAIYDKLVELKPKLGRSGDNMSQISATPLSNITRVKLNQERV